MFERVCQHCNKTFSNSRIYGGHLVSCSLNPDRISYKLPTVEWKLFCIRCGVEYHKKMSKDRYNRGNYTKFCSRSCANSRGVRSEDTRLRISNSMTRNKVIIESESNKEFISANCEFCNSEFKYIRSDNKKDKRFCSNKCNIESRKTVNASWVAGWINLGNIQPPEGIAHRELRKVLIKVSGEKCSKCSWSDRNEVTRTVPIEMDHIDGNHKNNKFSNLRLLCPNCHSLTPTFRNLNRGNGRSYRRELSRISDSE